MYRVFADTDIIKGKITFSTIEHTIIKETKCFYTISRGGKSGYMTSKTDHESHGLYLAESAEEAIEICARKMLEASIRIIDTETTKVNSIQKYLKENYNG